MLGAVLLALLLTLVVAPPAPARVSAATVGRSLLGSMDAGGAANLFVVGDSTGDEDQEWVYQLAIALERRYPGYTVNYYLWSKQRRAWPSSPNVFQWGSSGSAVLNVWNMSVSGSGVSYARNTAIAEIQRTHPDLLFVSYGHNEGAETDRFRWAVQSFVDEVRLDSPSTEIALVAQNPELGSTYQAERRDELAFLASREDLDFIDVYNAFEATGDPGAYTADDGIHPNSAGQSLWLGAILDRLGGGVTDPGAHRETDGIPAIRNGDFSVFTKGVPSGWTLSNAKVVRDFSQAEPSQRYALRLTQTGGAPASFSHPLDAKWLRGKWVTVAVRMYVPGQENSAQVGLVGVTDDRTAPADSVQVQSGIHGSYYWEIVSRVIDPRATKASVVVYVNQRPGHATVTIERVVAVVGDHVRLDDSSPPAPSGPHGDG